jgi:predicted enzyme related to lactoylglutathione lyase
VWPAWNPVGWTAHDQAFGPTTYTIFKKGDTQMTTEWGGVKPHWMPYIAVDDCDAYVKKITDNGGKVCVPAASPSSRTPTAAISRSSA